MPKAKRPRNVGADSCVYSDAAGAKAGSGRQAAGEELNVSFFGSEGSETPAEVEKLCIVELHELQGSLYLPTTKQRLSPVPGLGQTSKAVRFEYPHPGETTTVDRAGWFDGHRCVSLLYETHGPAAGFAAFLSLARTVAGRF